jgi:hypothetical protein
VALNNERIRQEGLKRQADVVMFGHTHRPFISEEEGITLLNPGSLAFPRQEGRQYSYIVMEKKHGEKPVFEVKYLD